MIILISLLVITFLGMISGAIYYTRRLKQQEFQRQINEYKLYYGYDINKNWELMSIYKKLVNKINSNLKLQYPVEGKETSQWGLRKSPYGKDTGGEINDFHEGLDISAKRGEPVYASESGYCEEAKNYLNTGKTIIIYHGWINTIYCHLDSINIKKNTWISKGELIGRVGSSGKYSTGNHLHFAIYNNIISNYQNPKLYLEGNK